MSRRARSLRVAAAFTMLLAAARCDSSGGGGTSTGGSGGTSSSSGGSGPGSAGRDTGGSPGQPNTGGSSSSGGSGPGTGGTIVATGGVGGSARGGTGGRSATGGTPGTGGTAGGAAGGAPSTGGTPGTGNAGGGLVWPNSMSSANSDPWLIQNHDRITQLQPRVLAMDLANTPSATATSLIQKHITGLANATSFHKYKNAAAQPALLYQLVKVVKASGPNYTQWNSQSFADSNIQIKDPANPTGPNLTLCQLFEKGIINEVWCMATQNQTKCGESQETKVVYTNADPPQKTTRIVDASNGDDVTNLGCKVSVRIIDFNTSRGVGCHQHAMGHAWERYMDSGALPMLRKQAARFLNWDLDTRVGAPFSNFYGACQSNGSQETDCMTWTSQIAMRSGPSAARSFNIPDMSGGCGNAHFYPNTTGTYSYDANTPDPMVLSSCEHYGMHDGPNGTDMTTPFTNAMTDQLAGMQTGSTDDDCGGHGTSYIYQSFPSYGTTAKNDDMTPMHDWWVYLFY